MKPEFLFPEYPLRPEYKAILLEIIPLPLKLGKLLGMCSALLVQQIHFWICTSNSTATEKEGYKWCYNTAHQWAEQLGEIYSVETIRKSLRDLVKRKLVVTGCYNKHKYDHTLWYRVDYEQLRLFLEKSLGEKWEIIPPSKQNYYTLLVKSTEAIPEVLLSKPQPLNGVLANANSLTPATQTGEGEEKKPPYPPLKKGKLNIVVKVIQAKVTGPSMIVPLTAKEILKNHEEKGAAGHDIPMYQWQKELSLLSDSKKKLPPLIAKDKAQFKYLEKQLGKEDTRKVITFVINNWESFCKKAQNSAGLTTYPDDPHIGFLVKHHTVAYNLMQSVAEVKLKVGEVVQKQKQPCYDEPKKLVPKYSMPKKNLLGEKDYKPHKKATPEELAAILEEHKQLQIKKK